MDAKSVIPVVTQLRTLSSDHANRPYIVRRGVLPGLKGFLEHSNLSVVRISAEALRNLSLHPDNTERIQREPGLVETLHRQFRRLKSLLSDSDASVAIKTVCECLLLLRTANEWEQEFAAANGVVVSRMEGGGQKKQRDEGLTRHRKENLTTMGDIQNGRKHNVELKVDRLFQQRTRNMLEGHLLSTKGVISFSMNISQSTVKIYTVLEDETLERVLKEKLRVDSISFRMCEKQESVVDHVHRKPTSTVPFSDQTSSRNLPKYLSPETAEKRRVKDAKAVFFHRGARDDSLTARIKKTQDTKKKEGGLFSKITSWW